MRIAFWSNAYESCGVSANMAAISVASVIRFPYTVMALENHLCHNNLGRAYLGTSNAEMTREAGTNYYEGGGIEGLLRRIYRGNYHQDILPFYRKEIIHRHLYYIPQSRVMNIELFDYELNHCIQPLFHLIEGYADICFIDTASRNNLSTKTILEESDLIVINLCQNPILLEEFFLNYSSLIPKAVFLVANYTMHSIFNNKRISKMYGIPSESIAVIPNNEVFCNAILNGSVVEFISSNYACNKDNPNYLFIQAVKKATSIIIKKADQICDYRRKEINLCGR